MEAFEPTTSFAADDREWIKDWRGGMFSSSSRDSEGWPIEMHGVVASWEKCLDALEAMEMLIHEAVTD